MLLKRRKLKPKFNQSMNNIFGINPTMPEVVHGRNGTNGKDGATGKDGANGINGRDGAKGADGVNGVSGKDGRDGKDGKNGRDGKDGRSIVGIDMFSRMMHVRYSDGTSDEFPLKFPSGSGNNPGFAGGGMEPPVKDIRAGENVEVTEKNGIYTVSSTGGGDSDETGLPYYFISSTDSVIVPLYRQHLTLGDVTVEGEFIINGEQVIL